MQAVDALLTRASFTEADADACADEAAREAAAANAVIAEANRITEELRGKYRIARALARQRR